MRGARASRVTPWRSSANRQHERASPASVFLVGDLEPIPQAFRQAPVLAESPFVDDDPRHVLVEQRLANRRFVSGRQLVNRPFA